MPWRGIWRVTLDGRFYGDYRTKSVAMERAESACDALIADGRDASVRFVAIPQQLLE